MNFLGRLRGGGDRGDGDRRRRGKRRLSGKFGFRLSGPSSSSSTPTPSRASAIDKEDEGKDHRSLSSPVSRLSNYSCSSDTISLASLVSGVCGPNCPGCGRGFGSGRRRMLVDSACGHGRCYECMFAFEQCPSCLPVMDQQQRKEMEASNDSSPHSNRSSAREGRESGFHSSTSSLATPVMPLSAINGGLRLRAPLLHVATDAIGGGGGGGGSSTFGSSLSFLNGDSQPGSLEDDSVSLCSSLSTAASSVGLMRHDLKRRSLCSVRSEASSRLARNSYVRRSYQLPHSSRMTAIREINSSQDTDRRSLSVASSCVSPYSNNVGGSNDLFTGRRWLLRDMMELFSSDLPTNGGYIITGGPGTGKTSVLKEIAQGGHSSYTRELSSRVIAHHFCQADDEPTCLVSCFVSSIATQLHRRLGDFKEFLDANTKLKNGLLSLTSDNQHLKGGGGGDPYSLFDQGVLKPLQELKSQGKLLHHSYCVILVDGLCEAECHRADGVDTIAAFLEKQLPRFPKWIKLVCTVRSSLSDIVKGFPFQRASLDDGGVDERLCKDMKDYIHLRLRQSPAIVQNSTPTSWKYDESPQTVLADHLIQVSLGCFLSAKLTLDLLERGKLVIKSSGYSVLPQTLSESFLLNLNLLFPTQRSFERARDIFSVCLAALRPMTLREIHRCLRALSDQSDVDWEDFLHSYSLVASFLPSKNSPCETVSFFHPSFREWLLGRRTCDENKFACDLRRGHLAIALHLSSKCPGGLEEDDTLDLAHHILKAQVFKTGGISSDQGLTSKELQAAWLAMASADVTAALAAKRNILQPNLVVSKLLLLAGASPDATTGRKRCASGEVEGVIESFGQPLLNEFIAGGKNEMAALLIKFGADVTSTDSRGVSPLMVASTHNNASMAGLLLATKPTSLVQSCNDGSTALSFAARADSLSTLKLLLSRGSWASEKEKTAVVQEALVGACKVGRVDALNVLVSEGAADVNEPCRISHEMPLRSAISAGQTRVVRELLRFGADVTKVDFPLHLSVMKGHFDVVEVLLHASGDACDSNGEDSLGRTPLAVAAMSGQTPLIELLASRGAFLDRPDHEGLTPLAWACIRGREAAVKLLLRLGAAVDAADMRQRTPLHHAAAGGRAAIATTLLETGANVEQAERNGLKPIDQAIAHGDRDTVSRFLKKGAKLGPTTWALAKDKPAVLFALLNKLLEDGNALYRHDRLSDACYRYEYALKKTPQVNNTGQEMTKLDSGFVQLRSHLLLNLSCAHRKAGNLVEAEKRACQALEGQRKGYCLPTAFSDSEALWARAKARFESCERMLDEAELEEATQNCQKALEDMREAVRLAPGNLQLHRFTSRVKEMMEKLANMKCDAAI